MDYSIIVLKIRNKIIIMRRIIIEIETKKGISYTPVKLYILEALKKSGIKEGICNIFLPEEKSGIIIEKNNPLILEDYRNMVERIVKDDRVYAYQNDAKTNLRTYFSKRSITIPISDGKLIVEDDILLWEFDSVPRKRKIIMTLI